MLDLIGDEGVKKYSVKHQARVIRATIEIKQ